MLRSSMYRVSLQGLKRPVVQQKVGAWSPSTYHQLDVNYVIPPVFSRTDLSNKKRVVGPIMGFSDFSVNKADVVYNSKCRVKEYFVIGNYFTISHRKIKSFQVKIFALLYVHPELDLL